MRKYFILLLCLVSLCNFSEPAKAYAEQQSLYVEAEIGFENYVKQDSPTVLNVKITNNGKPFSGDFVADIPVSYNFGSGLVFPLDIATGETKTIPIYLEGYTNSNNSDLFYFYEGGIEKGKQVKYDGSRVVNPRMKGPSAKTMVVVTTRPDELSAIEEMSKPLNQELVTYYATSKEDKYLVDDYKGLSIIDIIIFDNIAMQDLSQQQQQAIYKWVQSGGVLAFSPTELAKNGAGIFNEVMPLQLGNEMAVPKEVLNNYSNIEAVVDEIKIYESTIEKNSLPTFELDGYTFAAGTNIGQGKVIQFAFPLYDAVITNLRDYGQILKSALMVDAISSAMTSSVDSVSNWNYENELFDTFNVSVWVLIGGIFVYMIIIGPLLYRLLKKKDLREKMWFYIPVIAIVSSLGIFIVGAKDRIFSPQVQQMAIFKIGDDGLLQGTYLNSILSNRSGDFEFTMDNNTTAISSSNNGLDGIRLHHKSYLKEDSDGKTLSMLDFNYWSVQSIVGKTLIEDGGQLTADLNLQNKVLTGTITNTLPVDLFDLAILSNGGEYTLGSIKAGETININLKVNTQVLNAPFNNGRHTYNSGNGRDSEKIYLLKDYAINFSNSEEAPLLVGWSDISLVPIELTGGSKQNTISYFSKPLNINFVFEDEIVLTNEDTTPSLNVNDDTTWGDIQDITNTAHISPGEIPLIYEITNKEFFKNYKWNEISINYDEEDYYLSIKNSVTGELIELKDGQHAITENIEQYLTEGYQIEFIIERTNDDGRMITLPTFELKGEPIK